MLKLLYLFFLLFFYCTACFAQDDIYFKPDPPTAGQPQNSLPPKIIGSSAGLRLGAGAMYKIPGIIAGFDYTWFDNKHIGLGGKYIFFQHRISLPYSLTVHYFAPMLTFRIGDGFSWFYVNASYGLVLLDDFGGFVSQEGVTGGVGIELGADWNWFGNKYLGLKISGLGSVLRSYDYISPLASVTKEVPANISRIEVTLNLRFY